jgi:hypothetical protein
MADHDAGKPVTIGGDVVGELFAVFQDGDTLIEQLRKRAAAIGISYGLIEEIAGLGEGALQKYLSPLRVKKITIASMMQIGEVLGVRGVLVVDEALVRRMKPLWTKRDGKRVHARRPPPLGAATVKRVLPCIAAELGRRGHAAFMRKTTAEQRREIGRRGAAVRWARRAETSPQP